MQSSRRIHVPIAAYVLQAKALFTGCKSTGDEQGSLQRVAYQKARDICWLEPNSTINAELENTHT